MITAITAPSRARHRPTEIDYMVFEGFGAGKNGFHVMAWINDNGGQAHGDDGLLYIKNNRRKGRNWVSPGDRVARRLRYPSMEPTNDFYRLEPEVWADAYDDISRAES